MSSRPVAPDAPRVAVLGQGIAGTLVSTRLRENGVAHVVIDRGHRRSSSWAAAGLVNPVTGRRFVLVEGFGDYLARFGVYERLGRLLGERYVHDLTIYRDLGRVKDRNQWDMRRATPSYATYLGAPVRASEAGLPIGGVDRWVGPTRGAYRVDLAGLIRDYRRWLADERMLIVAEVDETFVRDDRLIAAGRPFDIVVDCRGAACAHTGEWGDRPWRLSKGESVRISREAWPRAAATKLSGSFLTPVGNGGEVWYGGTSTDHYDWDVPTEAMALRFDRELRELLGGYPPESLDHRAAIRPTTTDREPVVGPHATVPGLYICNGLGTKGALTAPSITARLWSMLAPVLGRGR